MINGNKGEKMQNVRQIGKDLFYIGCSDRRIPLFESAYPVPEGVSYNSYLLKDDKTVLFDTVDKACAGQFFENLAAGLNGRKLDYMVVHHMEPDHAALIQEVVMRYPEVKVVCTAKAKDMIKQFFDIDIDALIVKDGDTLSTGLHELVFATAPMVHWPEVMVSYDKTSGALFTADAFGSFGAINGHLFDDNVDWEKDCLDEARRYFTNIVGKYGAQVQMLLKKAIELDIKAIYPLHGLIIRKNIGAFVDKYNKWSTYTPEENGVLIAFSSVYGNTENAVDILAAKLADKGVKNIKMYDVSFTHPSVILSEAFKYSHIVLATTTYNMGVFESMENFLNMLVAHNLQNRKYVLIENGSWAPTCGGKMQSMLEPLKGSEFIADKLCIKSSLKDNQIENIETIADTIALQVNE